MNGNPLVIRQYPASIHANPAAIGAYGLVCGIFCGCIMDIVELSCNTHTCLVKIGYRLSQNLMAKVFHGILQS